VSGGWVIGPLGKAYLARRAGQEAKQAAMRTFGVGAYVWVPAGARWRAAVIDGYARKKVERVFVDAKTGKARGSGKRTPEGLVSRNPALAGSDRPTYSASATNILKWES
jgi:hypothetical protein